ncbi:MAG: phosphoribosylamine--glycine ligase, partial [Alistipes sp.]|nr:phosphoribosylamine--glycine ligase [Alistipes sp.]
NARFGDPETEVVLPLISSDIYDIFEAVATGRDAADPTWESLATLGIVLASKGYPGSYEKGYVIEGLEDVDGVVYHMGTAAKDGKIVTAGGRVMIVVCKAETLAAAHAKANAEVAKIKCDNLFYRTDIGHKAFK